MNGRPQQLLLHLTGCLVFLTLPILFSPESLTLHAYLTNPPTQRDIFFYVLIIGLFYINFYLLIPRLYFNRRFVLFCLINIGCFLFIHFLPDAILPPLAPGARHDHFPPPGLPQYPPQDHHSAFPDFSQHLFLFLLVIFFALLLKIRERWKETETEKMNAELSYLKAQINPHFLFNTLNSIYALAIEKSDKAPATIAQLSDMMRYVLTETGKEFVPLDKELRYIQNYIALQEARFGASIRLTFSVTGTTGGHRIAPLLLIPFIENAFKHGVNAEEDPEIRISIDIDGNKLHLFVYNKKVTINAPPDTHGNGPLDTHSGLGIHNTKARLQLLYPHDFAIEIKDNNTDFTVSLTLKLK